MRWITACVHRNMYLWTMPGFLLRRDRALRVVECRPLPIAEGSLLLDIGPFVDGPVLALRAL